eukprot:gene5995-11927_t
MRCGDGLLAAMLLQSATIGMADAENINNDCHNFFSAQLCTTIVKENCTWVGDKSDGYCTEVNTTAPTAAPTATPTASPFDAAGFDMDKIVAAAGGATASQG